MNASWRRNNKNDGGNGKGQNSNKPVTPVTALPPNRPKPNTVGYQMGGDGYVAESKAPGFPPGIRIPEIKQMEVFVPGMKVMLTQEAFEQLFGWAYSVGREITCLGVVNKTGDCEFIIERFYLVKQNGSGASSELDDTAVAELIEGLINNGKKDEASRMKCWAHSHPNMGVFWSGTDISTCNLLLSDYLISIVVTNNYTVKCRIDIRSPFKISFDCVPVYYGISGDKPEMKQYGEEAKKLVESIQYNISRVPVVWQSPLSKPDTYYCEYCGKWHPHGQCEFDEANWDTGDDGYDWYTLGADTVDDTDDEQVVTDMEVANQQCVNEIIAEGQMIEEKDLPF